MIGTSGLRNGLQHLHHPSTILQPEDIPRTTLSFGEGSQLDSHSRVQYYGSGRNRVGVFAKRRAQVFEWILMIIYPRCARTDVDCRPRNRTSCPGEIECT